MTASTMTAPRFPRAAGVVVTAWVVLALLGGATGFFVRLPFPGPQLIILALLAGTLVAASSMPALRAWIDRKSTRLNSSHQIISYAVFCLKKTNKHPLLLVPSYEQAPASTRRVTGDPGAPDSLLTPALTGSDAVGEALVVRVIAMRVIIAL